MNLLQNKRRYSLMVKGKEGREFSFPIYGTKEHYQSWLEAGLDVWEVVNTIPTWCPWWMVGIWCKVQSFLNFNWKTGDKS